MKDDSLQKDKVRHDHDVRAGRSQSQYREKLDLGKGTKNVKD